jgi:hypothetical protein
MGRQMTCRLISQPWFPYWSDRRAHSSRRAATPTSDHLSAKVSSSNTAITSKFRKITHSIGRRPPKKKNSLTVTVAPTTGAALATDSAATSLSARGIQGRL